MTTFQFFGGLALFGFLWLIFPRASFMVVLSLYLMRVHEFALFSVNQGAFNDAATAFIVVGVIVGIILDIVEHINTAGSL